jgi:GTP-binding protein
MGHKAIVVINKVDRKDAEPARVLNETFDLFIELGATEDQADFPVVYAQATAGKAGFTPDLGDDLQPLFDVILKHIPAPKVDPEAPLQLLVTMLGYDDYRGVTAIGRVFAGTIKAGQKLARMKLDGTILPESARYLYTFKGLNKVEIDEVIAGDIISLAGLEGIAIGETLADPANPIALPTIKVEEPTVRMTFGVNTSPFTGKEGTWGTSRKLRERLFEELRTNVSLRVEETESAENFLVSGRGELHLGILIETMRREGYEFQVSRPEVIYHKADDGALLEPFEEVHVETSNETVGVVVEMLGSRRGKMMDMQDAGQGMTRIVYIVPTRGLLGFRYQFLTSTRGEGVMHTIFNGYDELAGPMSSRTKGSIVAWEAGTTTAYALKTAEDRGQLFTGPGVAVYEGMVIGENARGGDLSVNVCKKKHLTNMRASGGDMEIRLVPPRQMSLDEAIEYLSDDELLEITPESYRIRKRVLSTDERGRQTKKAKEQLET